VSDQLKLNLSKITQKDSDTYEVKKNSKYKDNNSIKLDLKYSNKIYN